MLKVKDQFSQEAKKNLDWNRKVWGNHDDWVSRGYGYKWSKEEKRSQNYYDARKVIQKYLAPFTPEIGLDILELCPGAGRMSAELVNLANSLTLVDINPICIEICKDRLKYYDNISYHVNDGVSLEMIKPGSLDLIFSYDSFVHIDKEIVEQYVSQFSSKLKDGGVAWIHHSAIGARKIGSRSNMTDELMKEYAGKHDLLVAAQFYLYLIKEPKMHYGDVITVMRKISKETAQFVSVAADRLR